MSLRRRYIGDKDKKNWLEGKLIATFFCFCWALARVLDLAYQPDDTSKASEMNPMQLPDIDKSSNQPKQEPQSVQESANGKDHPKHGCCLFSLSKPACLNLTLVIIQYSLRCSSLHDFQSFFSSSICITFFPSLYLLSTPSTSSDACIKVAWEGISQPFTGICCRNRGGKVCRRSVRQKRIPINSANIVTRHHKANFPFEPTIFIPAASRLSGWTVPEAEAHSQLLRSMASKIFGSSNRDTGSVKHFEIRYVRHLFFRCSYELV